MMSRATVSYVLNDRPGKSLSPETRATVRRIARELSYQPNALAQSLKRGRSNTVLFPMPGIAMNHVLTSLFTACTDALSPRGLSLVLDISRHDDPAAQAEAWAGLAPAAVLDMVLHHDDPALQRLALIVRGADTADKDLTPESRGLEAIADGFRRL